METKKNKIKILIADDHNLFREMLFDMLSDEEDIEVIAQAHNGKEAVSHCLKHIPDVVVLDINMPIMDGLEAIREIHSINKEIKVVILTANEDDDYIFKFIREGATAYLMKDTTPSEMLATIRAAHFGESIVQPRVMNKIFKEFCKLSAAGEENIETKDTQAQESVKEEPSILTDREKEVLMMVAKGLNNKEISSALFISEATVKTHVANLMSKLGMRDRVELVLFALKSGFSTL